MPNYNLVINSQFKPFSYQEMLAPVLMATQAHQDLENQYSELSAKASVWEKLANEQTDSYAYDMYKTYTNDLEAQAAQLAREGLNAASRKNMLNMRSRYSKEITPIENAYTVRQKHIDEQRQARLSNPTIMFSRNASTTSLKDYINNPQLSYETQSGAVITKRVADAVKNYADTLLQTGEWQSTALGQLLERRQQTGLTREDIQMIISNPKYFPEIQSLLSNVVETSVGEWGDKNATEDALSYAREGLFAGLGKRTIDTQKDASYLNPYEQWKWDREREKEGNPEVPEDITGEGIYFPNIEIGTGVSEYNTFNSSNLKMSNDNILTSSEIEDIDRQIQDYQEKKRTLVNPESPQYKQMLGYNLNRQSIGGHDMILLSGQLDMLNNRLQVLEKQLENETDPEKKLDLESQIARQKDLILNKQDEIKGFAANVTLRSDYSSAIARLESKKRKIQDNIDKYYKKYGHLSENPVEAVQLGLAIDNQTSLSSVRANQISFGEDDKSTEYMLSSLLKSAKTSTTTNIYEVDDNGKPTSKLVSKKDLPETADGLSLLYSDYGLMYSDVEGNKYLIKSDDYSSKIAEESEVIRRHLTDFSKDRMKGAIMLEGNIVENGVLYNEEGLANMLVKSGLSKKQGNTISATLKQANGDIVNVVVYDINKSPKVIFSSMYDLKQGGNSFSDNKNKYRQFRGAELIGTYVNRKPSSSLIKDESYIVE